MRAQSNLVRRSRRLASHVMVIALLGLPGIAGASDYLILEVPTDEFETITDAVDHMRDLRAAGVTDPIEIMVKAGEGPAEDGAYVGSFTEPVEDEERLPIVIDEPDVWLRGGLQLTPPFQQGEEIPRPTGHVAGTETIIRAPGAEYTRGAAAVVVVARTVKHDDETDEDYVTGGDNVRVTGLWIEGISDEDQAPAPYAFTGLLFQDVTGAYASENYISNVGCIGLFSNGSSGEFERNYSTGNGCAGAIGNAAPVYVGANVMFGSNTFVDNDLGGMLIVGTTNQVPFDVGANTMMTPADLPAPDPYGESIAATIDNTALTGGGVFGLRYMGYAPDTTTRYTETNVTVTNSDLDSWWFGLSMDPGFAWKDRSERYTWEANLVLEGNTVTSLGGYADALLSMKTVWTHVNPGPDQGESSAFMQLEDSTYNVDDDGSLGSVNHFVGGSDNAIFLDDDLLRGADQN